VLEMNVNYIGNECELLVMNVNCGRNECELYW